MSNRAGSARGGVDPTEETHTLDYAEPEHTDIHDKGSRLLELLQDAVVIMLNVTLLGMAFVFLYRVWTEIIAFGDLQEGLSDIIYVVITIELYRLLVHYLRYHRVALNILVEVGVSVIIQKMILVGVDRFTMEQLIGISLILVALGAILWVHVRERHYDKPLTFPNAEPVADPVSPAERDREDRRVVGSPGDRKSTE